MSVDYVIDPKVKIVRLTLQGESTTEEWTSAMRAILRDSDYQPGFGFLADRRRANPPTITFTQHVLGFMMVKQDLLAGARWALVVANSTSFDMVRVGIKLGANAALPIPIQVFYDLEAAESWLRQTAPA